MQPVTYQQLLSQHYEESARDLLVYPEHEEDNIDTNDSLNPIGTTLTNPHEFNQFGGDRAAGTHIIVPGPYDDKGRNGVRYNKDVQTNIFSIDTRFRSYASPGVPAAPSSIIGQSNYVTPINSTSIAYTSNFVFHIERLIRNVISSKITSIEIPNKFYNLVDIRYNNYIQIALGTCSSTSNYVQVPVFITDNFTSGTNTCMPTTSRGLTGQTGFYYSNTSIIPALNTALSKALLPPGIISLIDTGSQNLQVPTGITLSVGQIISTTSSNYGSLTPSTNYIVNLVADNIFLLSLQTTPTLQIQTYSSTPTITLIISGNTYTITINQVGPTKVYVDTTVGLTVGPAIINTGSPNYDGNYTISSLGLDTTGPFCLLSTPINYNSISFPFSAYATISTPTSPKYFSDVTVSYKDGYCQFNNSSTAQTYTLNFMPLSTDPKPTIYAPLGSMLGFNLPSYDILPQSVSSSGNCNFECGQISSCESYGSVMGEDQIDMNADSYIYLAIADWNNVQHESVNDTQFSAFSRVPIVVPKGQLIYDTLFNSTITKIYHFLQPTNIQQFIVTLLDKTGNILLMPNVQWSMIIELEEVLSQALYEKLREL